MFGIHISCFCVLGDNGNKEFYQLEVGGIRNGKRYGRRENGGVGGMVGEDRKRDKRGERR